MAKFELIFNDCKDCSTLKTFIDVNTIKIVIINGFDDSRGIIELDKSTAIKFAKTLRTKINELTEMEVKNV